jgi:hypothetical protein
MTLAHDLLRFAGPVLLVFSAGMFVLLAIANLWASDEACQPAPDPDPKKKPEPAPPPAAAPGPTSNPVDVGWQFHDTRPGVQIQASLSPPLSTRGSVAGYWYGQQSRSKRPCWFHRLCWRLLFGVRWIPYNQP